MDSKHANNSEAEQPVTIQFSVDWLRLISIVMAVIGFLTLLPLAWAKFTHARNICPLNSGMDCELVVRSVYSEIGPLPVSYLGLIGFLLILLGLLFESRLSLANITIFGFALFGIMFSGYLITVQALVLRVWCQVCVQIAVIVTCLFVVSLIRVWRAIRIIPDDEDLKDGIA
ncbi:MAG: hypothetical protein KF726_10185 [Anaerolineae bacterium]|nr:hypothetical protein [Anaerolineae bacterium]